ncbi:MAG: ABC transporter permease [Acidobacteria bacterium]|nr:ABC transporter permease [Acidobacteriota bacterium]MYD71255.1 ABC transporter permease [Acidobacteriota bacterium]MYJ03951.1 ABC transporter permease [Acidobacteriota bacterium]
MKYLPFVWKNLFRRKTRTFFTVASIAVAFILFAYLMAVRQSFSMGVSVAGADRLLVSHKVSLIQPLPESYLGRIASVDGVADLSFSQWFGGIYQDPRNFFPQFAVDPESYLRLYPEIVLTDGERDAWFRNRTGAIVGRSLADRFGWEVGDRIPLQGTIFRTANDAPWEFTIDGIFEPGEEGFDTQILYFHYEYLAEANSLGERFVGQYVIRVEDPDAADAIAAAVDARFANSPAETKTSTESAFAQAFANQAGNIGAIISAVLAAVFFTILVIAGNTMAQAVRERTSELAVLKTLGFTDRKVLMLVLLESFALVAAGSGVGLGIGYLFIRAGDPTGGFLQGFHVPPGDWVLGIALAAGLGLLTGILPGVQATRLRIVNALRKV